MSTLALAAVMQLFFVTSPSDTDNYADAYKATQDTGKPLCILVGADWCPACQAMRNSVIPAVAAHGDLKNVAYAHVNTDRDGELAQQLLSGNSIPQLVIYTKTTTGWKLQRLVGAQSPEAVEDVINQASAASVAAHTVAAVDDGKAGIDKPAHN